MSFKTVLDYLFYCEGFSHAVSIDGDHDGDGDGHSNHDENDKAHVCLAGIRCWLGGLSALHSLHNIMFYSRAKKLQTQVLKARLYPRTNS